MKSVFRLLFICLPILAVGKPPDSQVSKNISRSFAMTAGGNLEINNKYGQVVISAWDEDSVSFSVDITAFGKSRSDARKILDRVEVDFDKTSQFLTAETVFDRNSSFFVEIWKSFTDEARSLLSKSKIEINYEVKIPRGMAINLENRYGDVYLSEMDGRMNLTVMHGNLRSNNLNANANIEVAFGDVRIKYMNSGRLVLKAADGDIIKVGNVTLSSSSSDLTIREAERLRLDSRSDKRLKFDKVTSLSGKGLFSNIIVGELTGSMELDLSYGEIEARRVAFNFSTIDIIAKAADIDLVLSPRSYITADIEGKEESMYLPLEFENLDKSYTDSKKIVKVRGKVGKANNYPAILSIQSTGGDITITQETDDNSTANLPEN